MAIQINREQIKAQAIDNNLISNTAAIAVTKLASSTISGITLGQNLAQLSAGNGLSMTGYNGSSAVTDLTLNLDGATLAVAGSGVKVADGGITDTQISGSAAIADSKLGTIAASNKVSGSAVQLSTNTALENSSGLRLKAATAGDGLAISASQVMSVTVDDSSIEIDSDSLRIKALGVSNSMLGGSIANAKLSNSSVSFGGISVALGSSDATPAFDLQDATGYPTSSLTGTITDAQLAGSIQFSKLADSANIARLDQAETVAATYTFTAIPQTSIAPTATGHLANKAYVDSVAQGLDLKGSCKVATTGNITLSGTQTIDGISIAAGDRVAVIAQSAASTNGLYVCAAGAWARTSDMATGSDAAGAFTFIEQGTVNADAGFVCTSDSGAAVVGTNVLAFTQFSGAGQITAGNGLSKTGDTLDVNVGDGVLITGDAVAIDLATNPGLQFTSNKLDLKVQSNQGLIKDGTGLKVDYDNSTIAISANKLALKADGVDFQHMRMRPFTEVAAGDGTQTVFTLPNRIPSSQLTDFVNCVRAHRNGIRLKPVASSPSGQDQYTVSDSGSATVVTFGSAPSNLDSIIIDYWAN